MELKKIERLLAKYYDSSTSIEEEVLLKAFFEQEAIPGYLKPDKEMFLFYTAEKEGDFPADLENNILEAIKGKEGKKSSKERRLPKYLYWVSSVAASLLIVLSVYLYQKSPSLEDTYDNPELAYMETKKVLYYVSSKLNKGTLPVEQNISKIADGTHEISKISKFSSSMEKVHSLSTNTDELVSLKYFKLYQNNE